MQMFVLTIGIWINLLHKLIFMGSSTVKAQKLANQTNLQIAQETNQLNREIAEAQNELNYKMFNEQNDWNLAQWNRENEYNSPTAQMERYIKAGINPLWAISNGDPGKAQQLTSAAAQPAAGATMVAPQVIPEYDPTRLNNIIAAANNVNNNLQGFLKLGLESMDVDTRRAVGHSQIGLNVAESMFKKSQTAGQDIFNNLNLDTYDALVGIKMRELDSLNVEISNKQKQGQLTDALIDNAKEEKNQIIAMTSLTNRQADKVLADIHQGWVRLGIEQQNANANTMNAATNQFVAQSNSYYQGENLKLSGQQFSFQVQQHVDELKLKSNEQLIELYNSNKGWLEKNLIGNIGTLLDGYSLAPDHKGTVDTNFAEIQAIGNILYDRFVSNPTMENYKSYTEWQNGINQLPVAPSVPIYKGANTSNSSVLNPSVPWQQ